MSCQLYNVSKELERNVFFYTFSMIFMSIPKNPHKSLGSWKFRFLRMCNGFLHSYIAINPHQNDRSYMPHSATFLLSLTRNRANIIFAFLYTEYCTFTQTSTSNARTWTLPWPKRHIFFFFFSHLKLVLQTLIDRKIYKKNVHIFYGANTI